MASFLIIAPFGAFAILMMVSSVAISLFAAAALSLGIVVWDVIRGGSLKMLAAGSVLIFSALGCYITLVDGNWSTVAVRLAVDVGLFSIVLLSLAIRLPFTLQYAREMVDAETLKLPGFMKANYILTWAWAGAFVLMLVADMLIIYMPSLPLWIGFAVAFAARNSAVAFTKWYPQYRRAKYGAVKPAEPLKP
jgi:intracellular septation protein A